VLLLCACRLNFDERASGDGGIDGDAPVLADASVDVAPGCFGVAPLAICPPGTPSGNRSLVPSLNTDTDCDFVEAQMTGPPMCVVAADRIAINVGVTVVVSGSRPLVLLAGTSLQIAGTLDVASHHAGPRGPGTNGMCASPGGGASATSGGGGGGAGGMGTRGGNGGAGTTGFAMGGGGSPVRTPSFLDAGCRGGPGGDGGAGEDGGVAGEGGGAVYLLAPMLQLDGVINASGGGGGGGDPNAGGGGGGSGGMIVIHASTLVATPTSTLLANGGGGGGGADATTPGLPGGEGAAAMALTPPPGGAGGGFAGSAGGAGGAGTSAGGNAGFGARAAGGGGGGVGIIRILAGGPFAGVASPPVQ